jgi:hypothetical protein
MSLVVLADMALTRGSHRRKTVARRARNSALSWISEKLLSWRSAPWIDAALSIVVSSSGARPCDFSSCSDGFWRVAMSSAMACRIPFAWSRSASAVIWLAAGSSVPANASHSDRIVSMWSVIKAVSVMRAFVKKWRIVCLFQLSAIN